MSGFLFGGHMNGVAFLPPEVWAQIGIGAVFLFLYLYMSREWKAEREKKDDRIRAKDEQIIDLNNRILDAYVSNVRASEGVKVAIDNNTKALEHVIDKICEDKKRLER